MSNKVLTMTRCRNRTGGVICIGTCADHRGITNAPPTFACHTTGGGASNQVTHSVEDGNANRSKLVIGFGRQARLPCPFVGLKCLAATLGVKVALWHPLNPLFRSKLFGTARCQHDMRRPLHDSARKGDRRLNGRHARNRSRIQLGAMHDRCIELMMPLPCVDRTTPCIEERRVLHALDNIHNNIKAHRTRFQLAMSLNNRLV